VGFDGQCNQLDIEAHIPGLAVGQVMTWVPVVQDTKDARRPSMYVTTCRAGQAFLSKGPPAAALNTLSDCAVTTVSVEEKGRRRSKKGKRTREVQNGGKAAIKRLLFPAERREPPISRAV